MIFQIDLQTNRTTATIQTDDHRKTIEYDCSFLSCDNPICTCNVIYVELTPLKNKSPNIVFLKKGIAIV